MDNRKVIYLDDALEAIRKLPNVGIHWFVSAEAVFGALLKLPSAPEPAIPISWLMEEIERLESRKNFTVMDIAQLKAHIRRWEREQNE